MKSTLIIILYTVFGLLQLNGQNYTKQSFATHLEKAAGDMTVYKIDLTEPTKAMVVSVDRSDVLTNAYIIANTDTIDLQVDEDTEAEELSIFSTLMNFNKSITSFYFFPGDIDGEVTFYYIKAESAMLPEDQTEDSKKKAVTAESPQ